MKFVCPGTPYQKNNDSSLFTHPKNCITKKKRDSSTRNRPSYIGVNATTVTV